MVKAYNQSLQSDARKSPRAAELKRYMPKIILITIFLLSSKLALACSCGSYTPLAVVYENADSIVHVKIEDIHKINIAPDNEKPEMSVSYVKAKIIKSIKGNILNNEIAIIPSMCGKTIYVESLETDHEYILPIITAKNNRSAIDHNDVGLDKYILPGCAHSGGELIKNEIYDYEYVSSESRTFLKHYMNYDEFINR